MNIAGGNSKTQTDLLIAAKSSRKAGIGCEYLGDIFFLNFIHKSPSNCTY